MTVKFTKYAAALMLMIVPALPMQGQSSRQVIDFNTGWLFEQDDWIGLHNASQTSWDDSRWIPVRTPHTYNAGDTFDSIPGYYRGYAWYRKHFMVDEQHRGRILKMRFGAIGNVSEIWVNGQYCGKSYLGYVPVEIVITDKVRYGEDNLIAVRVHNLHQEEVPPGRWRMDFNVYGGIYREVTLVSLSPVHLVEQDLFVTTSVVGNARAGINVSAVIANQTGESIAAEVRCILKKDGDEAAAFAQMINIPAGLPLRCDELNTTIREPALWSPDAPNLYTLEAILYVEGEEADRLSTKIGIRTARFDAAKGFFLNGAPLKLRGVNRHQDYPGLGSAVPVRLQIADAVQIVDLGANFVRTAHYPQHERFLDACDSLGLLVFEEVASWQHIGGNEFIDHMNDMMAAMIRRDRNHPSIILWGMMNEGRSAKMFDKLGNTARLLDPTRPTCYAENHIDVGTAQGTIFMPHVLGLNYRLEQYDALHEAHPHLKLLNTECSNAGNSYLGDLQSQLTAADKIEKDLEYLESRDWIAGSCIWGFHDYATEYKPVRPVQTSGLVDIYRREKEAARMVRARWSNEPYVRIAGHWHWPGEEGREREVRVWSNCDEVRLYLNGKEVSGADGVWKTVYVPGELKAIGIKGNRTVQHSIHTPGNATALQCIPGDNRMMADGFDALPVTVQMVDDKNNPVPLNGQTISFSVAGPARLVGIGGKTTATTAQGQAVILVQSTGAPGTVRVTAQCADLADIQEAEYLIKAAK